MPRIRYLYGCLVSWLRELLVYHTMVLNSRGIPHAGLIKYQSTVWSSLDIMLWTLHHQQSEFIQPQTADDHKCISDETPVKTLCFQIGIY